MSELQNPVFQDAELAREWLESHLWTDGPICPFCGVIGNATSLASRPGLYQCNNAECRKQFTVTVGTLFERSHIPLNKWLLAAFLICSSKKGISTHQMHRMIGVSYKSTWFMMHRIREAMREGKFPGGMGGENQVLRLMKPTSAASPRTARTMSRRKRPLSPSWNAVAALARITCPPSRPRTCARSSSSRSTASPT